MNERGAPMCPQHLLACVTLAFEGQCDVLLSNKKGASYLFYMSHTLCFPMPSPWHSESPQSIIPSAGQPMSSNVFRHISLHVELSQMAC
jgi:hypothetical protein